MIKNSSFIISERKILNEITLSKIVYNAEEIHNACAYLADPSVPWRKSDTGTNAYEIYRALIERASGTPITVVIDLDEEYSEKLRALLLAAVYGRVSLLIRSATSKNEIYLALQCFHRVFCELEAEGKEFNGYIRIGVCIDTPCLLLQDLSAIDRIDFFIISSERLITLMCGGKKNILPDAIEVVRDRINEFYRENGEKPISACIGERSASDSFLKTYKKNSVTDFFCEDELHIILTKTGT